MIIEIIGEIFQYSQESIEDADKERNISRNHDIQGK